VRIQKLFRNSEYPFYTGMFEVYFYVRGEKKKIIVDDEIPWYDQAG